MSSANWHDHYCNLSVHAPTEVNNQADFRIDTSYLV